MERNIIRDTFFLRQKSLPASRDDLQTAQDLLDTFEANKDRCVGLAANMTGVLRRILVLDNEGTPLVMLNPEIISRAESYSTEEGCLSLDGTRPVTRWRKIKVRWQDTGLRTRIKTFTDFPAQIIQHEMDHFEGILI